LGGVGSPSTTETVALIRRASEVPLDGLLVVTPAYNKPSQEGLFQHFSACAAATPLPIMLYNVPGRTMVNLEPSTVLRLAEIDTVVALKEAGALLQVGEVTAHAPQGFDVYSGADEYNLPVLALGGVGSVSVIGHVVGDLSEARRLHLKTLPITSAMFSVPNPVPTKTALEMLGVLSRSRVRLPLIEANDTERAAIKTALTAYGLLPQ
jgi:4-hydroxy-tetrahydrodipicolinate synthase